MVLADSTGLNTTAVNGYTKKERFVKLLKIYAASEMP